MQVMAAYGNWVLFCFVFLSNLCLEVIRWVFTILVVIVGGPHGSVVLFLLFFLEIII